MARKNYPDEFKRDAVALYRDTEGATITTIAAELGVSRVVRCGRHPGCQDRR
jgi:transposase